MEQQLKHVKHALRNVHLKQKLKLPKRQKSFANPAISKVWKKQKSKK